MKRLIICILVVFAFGTSVSAQDFNALWEKANTAYYENDYVGAAELYDSINRSGMESPRLYFNMGNAYFKSGKIGKSILYYNKAQRLAPGDEDITHNLEIANTYTRNRIEPIPEFFLKKWMRSFRSIMGGNAWALTSIILFALILGGVLLYMLPLGRRTRKTGFYGGLAALVLFIFAISFAATDHNEISDSTKAIITSPSASVKSSPDNAGKDLFLIYEGAKVEVRDALNGWREIVLEDGNRGWVKAAAIEMI